MSFTRSSKETGLVRRGGNISGLRTSADTTFSVDGESTITAKLQMLAAKLKNPQPVLNEIKNLFETMEAQRFSNGGAASEFGISDHWQENADRTILDKGHDTVLVNYGFLEDAAVHPEWQTVGQKGLRAIIDPRNSIKKDPSVFKAYGWTVGNYGYRHQMGTSRGGIKREFVTITEEFRKISVELMDLYLDLNKAGENPEVQKTAKHTEKFKKEAKIRTAKHRSENAETFKSKHKPKEQNTENSSIFSAQQNKHQLYADYAKHSHIQTGSPLQLEHQKISTTDKIIRELRNANLIKDKHTASEAAAAHEIIQIHSGGAFKTFPEFKKHISNFKKFQATYKQKVADGMHKP
jgi:hypothetical protein